MAQHQPPPLTDAEEYENAVANGDTDKMAHLDRALDDSVRDALERLKRAKIKNPDS